ncbi:winged helix-turn-helix domain-containing protein [Pseudoalteromonas neustonica]|uniref:winged helix-turn-helix domain-containing protein n=1 Tax=Pseudoalteromonas neustonica TaxID=1840331 RepID=UPI0007DB06AB|nr:winged helix-turn-helix domain-containing protein [Pseudoalteromonas neustonica]
MININAKQLNPTTGELHSQGKITQLEPKVLAVFNSLYQAKGELVSQQYLLDTIWAGSVVAPNALQRCITQLRKHLDDDNKTLIQTFSKRGYRLSLKETQSAPQQALFNTNKRVVLPSVFALMAVATVIIFLYASPVRNFFTAKSILTVTDISPVTYNQAAELEGQNHQHLYAYIEQADTPQPKYTDKLMLLNTLTGRTSTLLESADFYTSPVFNDQGDTVLISQQINQPNKVKCSQLTTIQLSPPFVTQLIGQCKPPDIKQALWLDAGTALLVSDTQLTRLTVNSDQHTHITGLPYNLNTIGWVNIDKTNSDQPVLLLGGLTDSNIPMVWFMSLKNNQLTTMSAEALTYSQLHASPMQPLSKNTQLQTHNNTLYVYKNGQLATQTPFLGNNNVTLTDVIDTHTLLATQSYQDQAILERRFSTSKGFYDTYIADSEFLEQSAQYQPRSMQLDQGIAFLSERTGKRQLWFVNSKGAKQLTFMHPIEHFTWHADGQALWFLSDDSLNRVDLSGVVSTFSLQTSIDLLFQHSAQLNTPFLLARTRNTKQLIKLDLNSMTASVLFRGPIHWAQITNTGQLFAATTEHPIIQQLQNNALEQVSALQNIHLHWRFYYRDNKLIVADKNQHIYAYDPTQKAIAVLGTYDEKTLLASDFKLAPFSLLATTPMAKKANLVKIKINLQQPPLLQ